MQNKVLVAHVEAHVVDNTLQGSSEEKLYSEGDGQGEELQSDKAKVCFSRN